MISYTFSILVKICGGNLTNSKLKHAKTLIKYSFINNKYLILLSVLAFFIPVFIAIIFTKNLGPLMEPLIALLKKQILEGQVSITYSSIFLNNISSVLRMYVGGLAFGLLPFFGLFLNGLLVGYFVGKGPVVIILLYIVPHGIFEIPGLILAASSGFILFKFVIRFLSNLSKPDWEYIKENNIKSSDGDEFSKDNIKFKDKVSISFRKNKSVLIESLVLLAISAILFVIAAYIEVYLTRDIAHYFITNYHLI